MRTLIAMGGGLFMSVAIISLTPGLGWARRLVGHVALTLSLFALAYLAAGWPR